MQSVNNRLAISIHWHTVSRIFIKKSG